MSGKIELTIALPDGVYKNLKADKILLPAEKGNITILPQRAPILLQLKEGVIQALDEQNAIKEEFFISGGFADVAEDKCLVTTLLKK